MKTVLILGAGVGGVVAAHEMRKQLGKSVRVIIFDKQHDHTFAPSLLWLMIGERTADQIRRPIKALSRYGEVVLGEIEHIDASAMTVTANGKEYKGDYIIIALGAETEAPLELHKHGHNLYTTEGAENFHHALRTFSKGTISFVIPTLPYKCPAAPYEAAMLTDAFVRAHTQRSDIALKLFSPEPGPMPVAGKVISDNVRSILQQKQIDYYSGYQLTSVEPGTLHFANSESSSFDLLGYIPQHHPPSVLQSADIELTPQGWVQINSRTLQTSVPRVFALGDATSVTLTNNKPLPKAGVFAHAQAEAVAKTIADDIRGNGTIHEFDGHGACFLEVGDGKAGYATGNFYAEPDPAVAMKSIGLFRHWSKVAFEKFWFFKYF